MFTRLKTRLAQRAIEKRAQSVSGRPKPATSRRPKIGQFEGERFAVYPPPHTRRKGETHGEPTQNGPDRHNSRTPSSRLVEPTDCQGVRHSPGDCGPAYRRGKAPVKTGQGAHRQKGVSQMLPRGGMVAGARHPAGLSRHPYRDQGAHCRPLDPASLSLLPGRQGQSTPAMGSFEAVTLW